MPLLFLIAGLVLIVTTIRGTIGDLSSALAQDVSGGYLKWLAAILVIGLLGYVPALKMPSRYLLGLVALVVLITSGSGFISKLVDQLQNPGTATTTTAPGGNPNLPAIPVQSGGGTQSGLPSGGQSGGGSFNPVATIASIARFF